MADTMQPDDHDTTNSPTAASILGIKGHLRLRPHGSSQKAHIVLRRVELNKDSGDEGDDGNVVYFSLFAQKRIEVKPGKEILLTIGDGPFKDQAIIFEGDIPSEPSLSDEEEDTQVAEDEEDLVPTDHLIPPKMRKPWIKRVEGPVVIDSVHTPMPNYQSVAIQAQPEMTAASVQAVSTTPERISTASQTPPREHSSDMSIQTDSSLLSPVHEIPSTEVFAELDTISIQEASLLETDQQSDRERSLSPMELDSPPSSPTQSPIRTPTDLPASLSQERFIPGLQFSQSEAHINTISYQSATSPKSKSPVTTIRQPLIVTAAPSRSPLLTNNVRQNGASTYVDPLTSAVASAPCQTTKASSNNSQQPYSLQTPPASRSPSLMPRRRAGSNSHQPLPPQHIAFSQQSALADSSHASPSALADIGAHTRTPSVKANKRKHVVNPFVSGGFMTDFVGSPSQPTPDKPVVYEDRLRKPDTMAKDAHMPNVHTPVKREGSPHSSSKISKASQSPVTSTSVVQPIRQHPAFGHHFQPYPPQSMYGQPIHPSTMMHPTMSIPNMLPPSNIPRIQHTSSVPAQPIAIPHMASSSVLPTWHSQSQSPHPTPEASSTSSTSSILAAMGFDPSAWTAALLRTSAASPASQAPVPLAPAPLALPSASFRHPNFVPASSTAINSAAPSGNSAPIPIPIPIPMNHPASQYSPLNPSFARDPSPMSGPKGYSMPQDFGSQFSPPPGTRFGSSPQNSNVSSHPLPMKPQVLPPMPHLSRHASPLAAPARAAEARSRAAPQPPAPTSGYKRKVSPIAIPESPPPTVQSGGMSPPVQPSFNWPVVHSDRVVRINGDHVGIRGISFDSTGQYLAVNCHDCTVRVFENGSHSEIAKLSHPAPVVAAAWMEDDEGILSLSENGVISKWSRNDDQWYWTKVADASNPERKPEDIPTTMAYTKDRIAVAYPRIGVKVWMLNKGTWQSQRSILRQNVTAIKFVEDGDALLGGTKDGVLWYCQIPNGTLRAYTFFKSQVYHIDINSSGSHALVAQMGGRTHLVGIRQDDNKGLVEQAYVLKDAELQAKANYDFGASFTSKGKGVLFGCADGNVIVWDKNKAEPMCGLDHGEDVVTQAVGSYTSKSSNADFWLVTGSDDGRLTWWMQPQSSDFEDSESPRKRMKTN